MTQPPIIELENDHDRDYMVLCYDGQRLDLEEFFYHPETLYQLTHKVTQEKKIFWVIGYEMPDLNVFKRSIAKKDVQINLLLRVVKNDEGKLVASSTITTYDFPACLDDVLSPDSWAIELLNDKVAFTRVEQQHTLLSIYKNDAPIKKPPIDLSRTSLKPIASTPLVSTKSNTFWVRRDDAQRVTRILTKWVALSSANSTHLTWTIVYSSSTGFNILRKGDLLFCFDPHTRELTSPYPLEKIKNEFETMATEAIKNYAENHDNHELARHLFLRSVSFTENSFSGFWLHMLSLKKEGNDLKLNPNVRRTRRIPKY